MANEKFNELLRRMPAIAKAVNSFSSETIQQQAYAALLEAFGDSVNHEPDEVETNNGSRSARESAGVVSTADILAMARSNKPQGAAAPAKAAKATQQDESDDTGKPSAVEEFKEESNYLAGNIGTEQNDGTDHFGKASVQLLKHHGTYQQDNRDARSGGKSGRSYMFMVRTRLPGGALTSAQLLAELDLGDELANNTLRITSRQGLQLHGVLKSNLKETIRRINEVQLTTLGACGDVNRNTMCCPAPYKSELYEANSRLAHELAEHFAPRTSAYHELWLRDEASDEKELVGGGSQDEFVEPIYGKLYLPRKFKMSITMPHDNCVDAYTHDLSLMAIEREGALIGYNVLVGGGLGVTPSAAKTFPALAKRMTFVEPSQAVAIAEAVVKVQRDFGNRSDRKVARLKYLIHNWGLEKFKAKVEEYFGAKLPDPEPEDVFGFNNHMGWDEQGDGKLFYGLNVENGRLADTDKMQLKSAVREICRTFQPGIRLTAHQSMLFTDLEPEAKDEFHKILQAHHVKPSEEVSTARKLSMACVAWPTCGLSITEAERALPGVMDQMDEALAKLGLSSEEFTVRMTGCPNGCARPYNADIGLVGKTKGKYTLFLGGRLLGNRLNFIYKDLVPEADVVTELVPIFSYFKQDRNESEKFGDFCDRKGKDDLLKFAEAFAETV